MATEEQNNPLGDDALKAAAREAVKFQPLPEPDLAGMAEPAVAFDFKGNDFAWARGAANSNEKPQALALVSDEDEKVPRAVREAEAAALVVEMGLSLADPAVAKAVDAILKSRTRKELSENIAEARDALQSIAAEKSQSASGGGVDGKGDDINAMHKEFYANDPEYRAKVDKVARDREEAQSNFNPKQQKMDALAGELGITTQHDEARADIEKEIAKRKKAGAPPHELETLEMERARVLLLQNREREAVARAGGHGAAADQFHGHEDPAKEYLTLAQKRLAELKEALLTAREKQLMNEVPRKSEEEMKKALAETAQDFDNTCKTKIAANNHADIETFINKTRLRIQSDTRDQEAGANKITGQTGFETQEASPATPPTAPPVQLASKPAAPGKDSPLAF